MDWINLIRDSKVFKKYNYSANEVKSIFNSIIYKATEDKEKNLWIATDGGLCRYDRNNDCFERYVQSIKLQSQTNTFQFHDIFIDRQGIMWFCSPVKGVYYSYKPGKNFSKNPFICGILNGTSVTRILEEKNRNIWIGTNGSGIYLFESDNKSYKHFPKIPENFQKVGGTSVFAIYEDSKGIIWTGTYKGGLCRYDKKSGLFVSYLPNPENPNSISHNDVRDILEDKEGKLWIATNGGGLNLFDRDKQIFYHFRHNPARTNSIISNYCLKILEDKKGNLWIGTYEGLSVFNSKNRKFINYSHNNNIKNSLSNDWIYSILEDSKSNIWIGTAEGFDLFEPATQSFKHYYNFNGLPDNTINGILEDNNCNLWLSTNNGISKFDPAHNVFTNYDYRDGLQGKEFFYGSCFKSRDGTMFFGGLSGINIFDPGNIVLNDYKPPVVIKNIKINNKLLNRRDWLFSENPKIVLSYKQNTISFDFAALNYIEPQRNLYSYKLEGFNTDWVFAGTQTTCTYTNLSPGGYVFMVKGSNNDDVWNNRGAIITLIIKAPLWKTYWAYSFYILILFAMLYLYTKYTIVKISTKKDFLLEHYKREKSEELNQLKIKFFTNVTHEFRTPLTLIIAPLEKMMNSKKTNKNQLLLIYKNAKRLLHLVNQLMEFRKIDSKNLNLKVQKGDIVDFIKQVTDAFTGLAKQKQISFEFNPLIDSIELWFDHDKVEKILYNLLSNAFKFTPKNGRISVTVGNTEDTGLPGDKQSKYVEIIVKDTGIGIPDEDLTKIYSEFYQVNNHSGQIGTGIGLALTKELVELHKGKITVTSELQKGSCFTVYLPVGNKHFSADIISDENIYSFSPSGIHELINNEFNNFYNEIIYSEEPEEAPSEPGAPAIMLVDDNDELRLFMRSSLKLKYRIIEAANGKEALEIAVQKSPDIIITDVMMPLMNGIELCRKLKDNIHTSHIPVIILTAKDNTDEKIESLKSGADDFIPKPFNENELLLKIQNVINTRKKLQDKFKRDLIIEPKEITVTSADEKFLAHIMKIVESNINNPDFDIVSSVSDIGISRSVLYRKMQKLINQSPHEFVNSIRLIKAAKLLSQKKMKVSEVAYEVGFNDPLYFSKCFKKQFGKAPSDYVKNNSK